MRFLSPASRSLRTLITIVVVAAAVPAFAQVLLDPLTQPKFIKALPVPPAIDVTGGGSWSFDVKPCVQDLGLVDPITAQPLLTNLWGYDGRYPGPTFVARKDVPVEIEWRNRLVDDNGVPVPHLLPVDTSFHWAHPENWPACGVPIVTHIHGGHTESASDGLPDAWYTPDYAQTGHGFVRPTYYYDNSQEAATIWYHDHALGVTRLNVHAGLAGFYLIRDENEDALAAAGNLPVGPYELGLAIQDRDFTADGQLYRPSMPPLPGGPEPSILPEYFGNFILVNGMTWPVLDVEPRQYRLRFLNGADSRFFDMWLADPLNAAAPVPTMHQIGTDAGLLNTPVPLPRLLLGCGERADVVVDFSNPALAGRTFILRNSGKTPFPAGTNTDPRTTGQIMAFRVVKPLDQAWPPTTLPTDLRPVHGPIQPLVPTAGLPERQLVLAEMMDQYGRMMPMLGTAQQGAMMFTDPITENPMLDDTEVWTIYNTTPDAHPIHLHLVAFQILSRQKYKATIEPMTAAVANVKLGGNPKGPLPNERGWKDTAIMYPGEVTRVIAKFDREGMYVWHCHILSHEEYDMMRPFYVGEMPDHGGMPMATGPTDAVKSVRATAMELDGNSPNPFNPSTRISFRLPGDGPVTLRVFDVRGALVRTLVDAALVAGTHAVTWDGADDQGAPAASGVYVYELRAGDQVASGRMTLTK
jgi:spore coat protein A